MTDADLPPLSELATVHYDVGDVVDWHPDGGFGLRWLVTAVHGHGRVTIETTLTEAAGVRKVLRSAFTRDCRVVGRRARGSGG